MVRSVLSNAGDAVSAPLLRTENLKTWFFTRNGVVKAVDNYGAGDVVEIKFAAGGGDLFAFTRENFPTVDVAAGRIVFVPPATVSAREEE